MQDAVALADERGEQDRTTTLTATVEEVREAAGRLRHLTTESTRCCSPTRASFPPSKASHGPAPHPSRWTPPRSRDCRRRSSPVYAAVARATQAARSSPLHLRLTHEEATVSLTVDGAELDDAATEAISDRVLALGGTMSVVDRSLTLDLPCG